MCIWAARLNMVGLRFEARRLCSDPLFVRGAQHWFAASRLFIVYAGSPTILRGAAGGSSSFAAELWGELQSYASIEENKAKKGNFDAKAFYAILIPHLNLDKEADEYEQAEDDVIGDDDVGEAKLLVLGRLLCKSLPYTGQ